MSPLEDMGRSLVTGVEKGVTGTLGLPRTLSGVADWAALKGAQGGNWLAGRGTQLTPAQQQAVLATSHAMQPALPFGLVNSQAPSAAQMDQAVQSVAGPYHNPQTLPGRFAETGGEFAGGAILPGGPAARVARVVLPALAAQSAAEVAPEPYKGWAKLAGGLVGGGIESGAEGVGQAPAAAFGRALPTGLDADTVNTIAALRNSAAARGIDLTIPEAVAQVTGNLGPTNLQRTLENSARLRRVLSPYFAQRPDQVRGAVMNFVGDLGPMGDPGMLGLDANRAAQGAQMDAMSYRGQAARAAGYDAADAQDVDRQAMADLVAGVADKARADPTGLIGPRLGELHSSLTDYDGQPITSIGDLSTARNYWQDVLDQPPGSGSYLNRRVAAALSPHLEALDALLKANPDMQAGDQAFAGASRNLVDPLSSGPLGAIGRTEDLPAQLDALFPRNPPMGQSGTTTRSLAALGSQNDTLPAQLVAQHLGSQFNQSARDLVAGPNQYAGALYAKDLLGNAEQAATVRGALGQVDPSGDMGGQFDDLVDALQATGKRQPIGSQTASYLENQNLMHRAPAAIRFFGALGDPLEWTKNLSNWTGGALYGRNLDVLADMIRDPDTAAVLARAAGAAPASNPGAQIVLPFAAASSGP